jgi:UDPglucose 6-dehydrogenase
MRIGVVGTGYVGLVSGAGFSEMGLEVTCVDIDEERVAALNRGEMPIYEPGLEDLVEVNVKADRLKFTTDLDAAVKGASAVFLAVGTPMSDSGEADLTYVFQAAEQIIDAADGPLVLVTKSTVPVGTGEKIRALIAKKKPAFPISVASNPEFLKEGAAVSDFLKPDRIVIGTDDEDAQKLLDKLYRPFTLRDHTVLHMDVRSAELTKYAANCMLAARISFMNEMAGLVERVGGNIDAIRQGISTDKRIGSSFLYAGVGYGGSCFPKDVVALIHTAREAGYNLKIMEAVEDVNQRQRGLMLEKLIKHFGGELEGRTIGIWGIAFKPGTDDIREAPAINLIEGLLAQGANVRAYDRAALEHARDRFGDKITLCHDEYDVTEGAHALVLMTEWSEFRLPDWEEVKSRMQTPAVFDGRNIYDPENLIDKGFHYEGIGRARSS